MGRGTGGSGRGGGGGGGVRVMSEDDFVRANSPRVDSSLIRMNSAMSGAQIRRARAEYNRQLDAEFSARAAARQEYQRLVASGAIRPPTRVESLISKARGHEDNPSVQAARRILQRMGRTW